MAVWRADGRSADRATRSRPARRRSAVMPAGLVLALAAGSSSRHALAQGAEQPGPAMRESPVPGPVGEARTTTGEPGFMTDLWTRSNLLGEIGGLRTFLGNYGISI